MLLSYAFKDCIEGVYIHTRHSWQAVQHRPPPHQDERHREAHSWAVLRRRCSLDLTHGRRLAAASQSPCTCVQGARADHQPTKDQCNGIRHRLSPKYRHRRGHNLESMDSFTYLKSSISNSISIATKIKAGSAGPGEENAPRPHP